jgi:hypothetical protein
MSPDLSLILLEVSQHGSLTAIGQKKDSSHSLVFSRDRCKSDRELRSGPPVNYFKNRSHGPNLSSS